MSLTPRMPSARGETRGLLAPISRAELADLLAPVCASMYAGGSVVELRWCPSCDQWMRQGSAAAGRCVDCGTLRVAQHQVVMGAVGERDPVWNEEGPADGERGLRLFA